MGLIAGPAWALVNCILAQAVSVTAADRTEARARIQASDLRFDAETRPAFRLTLTSPRTSYAFGYVPTITALAFGVPDEGEVIVTQSGDASAQFRWEHTTFSISEAGQYGIRNFRAMSVGATPPPSGTTGTTPPGGTTGTTPPGGTGPTPPGTGTTPAPIGPNASSQFQLIDEDITLASSQTTAALHQIFSPRTLGTVIAGYEYGGGIGEKSARFLPIRKGPSATVSFLWRATRADDVSTISDGTSLETGSTVQPGTTLRAQIVDLGEKWTHRWAPALTGSFFAGAAAAWSSSDGLPRRETSALVPVATASLESTFGVSGGRLHSSSFVQFAPIIDRFTGDFDQRIQWVFDVSWSRYRLSLLGNFSGAQSVLPREAFSNTTVLPFNYYSGSASVLYRFTREVSAETGLRAAWSRADGPDAPLLWSVFVAGTYVFNATYL
jgi:hypothetical protein